LGKSASSVTPTSNSLVGKYSSSLPQGTVYQSGSLDPSTYFKN